MPTAVATAPGQATLSPKLGGAILQPSPVNVARLAPSVVNDAHITFTTPVTPSAAAIVGSAVVGTSTVG